MVYIIPSKRSSHTRMKYFSKYTDCDKTDLFVLQKIKSPSNRRPPFRIVTRGSATYYEVAYSTEFATLRDNEWKYIKEEVPKRIPQNLSEKVQLAWIISHFTCLAIEVDGARDFVRGEDFANIDRDAYDRDDDDADTGDNGTENESNVPSSTQCKEQSITKSVSTPCEASKKESVITTTSDSEVQRRKRLAQTALDPKSLVSTSTWPLRGLVCYLIAIAVTNMPMMMLRESNSHTFLATLVILNLILFLFMVLGKPATIGISILQPVKSLNKVISLSTLRALVAGKKVVADSTEVKTGTTTVSNDQATDDVSDEEEDDAPAEARKPTLIAGESNAGKATDVTPEGVVPGLTLHVSSTSPEPNSYSDPQGESWNVRCGPNYKKNKNKDYSRTSLFRLHGMDVFQSNSKIPHAFRHMNEELVRNLKVVPYVDLGVEIDRLRAAAAASQQEIPVGYPTSNPGDESVDFSVPPVSPVHSDAPNFHLGTMEKPFMFIVNMQIPTDAPSMMSTKSDGPTLTLLWYLIATEETQRDLMRPVPLNPAVRLVKKLAETDPRTKEGHDLLFRMKALPRLVNEKEFNFNYLMASTVSQYNAKPFLTRPQHTIFRGPGYLEYDLDIHGFCYAARKVLHSFLPMMEKVVLDWGFTLEAYEDDEMPEVIIGSMRVFKIKPTAFPSWEETMKALEKTKLEKASEPVSKKSASTSPSSTSPSIAVETSSPESTAISPSKKK